MPELTRINVAAITSDDAGIVTIRGADGELRDVVVKQLDGGGYHVASQLRPGNKVDVNEIYDTVGRVLPDATRTEVLALTVKQALAVMGIAGGQIDAVKKLIAEAVEKNGDAPVSPLPAPTTPAAHPVAG
jgi:hypothetical protein